MIPELRKPRVTEIQVRIDCNGCVQKIKKALHGLDGIYDLRINFPQQKLIIIGWADPEKIIKAIRKTRKIATICSHSEPSDPPAQATEPAPGQPTEQAPPAPDAANPPPAEAAPPAEPPKGPTPPLPENPPPGAPPSTAANDAPATASQPAQPSRPKDVEEVHVIYHYPPDYGHRYGYGHGYGHSYGNSYGGQWNNYPNGPGYRPEPAPPVPSPPISSPPVYATHSYNAYRPSSYVMTSPYVTHSYNTYKPSPYVTEYEYSNRSPPRYTHYRRPEHYSADYNNSNNGNGNITSMFSDENPNACKIV